MNVNDKVEYLDSQIKRRTNMVSLPPPDQINRNLQVIDQMRRDGDLPQPGRIYQKGIENSKNYTSGASQFIYTTNLIQSRARQNKSNYGATIGSPQLPPEMANKRVGRFSNSPNALNSSLNQKRDEVMREFSRDHEMQYLQHQVRRMESPELGHYENMH